jgi:anti-sigma factor RsiW
MNAPSGGVDPRVDLYIDGLLSGDELAAFERELAGSESLRRQLESQDRIDTGLKALYAYDPTRVEMLVAPSVIGRVDSRSAAPTAPPASATKAGSLARLRWYGLAAAVCLAAAGIWATYVNLTTPSFEKFLGPAEVYAMVDKPEFVCKNDQEFADAVEKRLGQPLVLAAAPGIEALGWAYGDDYNGKIVGAKTMVLINRVGDQKVLVFMDRKRDDRTIAVPAGSGLNLHRREIGSLVVYEVTPLPKAEVIDHLYDPRTGKPPQR